MFKPDWKIPANVSAVASTREGGFSAEPYKSLNLGNHVGDSPELVAKNRQWLVEQKVLPAQPVWLNQTHSTKIITVSEWTSEVLDADGIFTTTPGIVCSVMTADCLPVLLTNTQGTEVAAVHAGWRGLADGILENAVRCFTEPGDVVGWIGPAISDQFFEIGKEVVKKFVEMDSNFINAFEPREGFPGKWMGNLAMIAQQKLLKLGISDVSASGLCTYKNEAQFFSYRRDGQTGRQACFIWINA
ncbi:peptidoglycan editing factor PgeF [Vibrio salinus]|uniref:peptidoglycan editing factor PgeF n=1 Tax=Vibrio salinus TaxID=2899784 RepID=UPI001E338D72|nr:peptidoglycan editing factor PgeF [Vibrio salinus]MCE0493209.1 peptidoglycan editing factor PgeF [Vibrio salinus]